MTKIKWVLFFSVLSVFFYFGYTQLFPNTRSPEKEIHSVSNLKSYWTCPMHPSIHSDHPGECPICHMKLVQVKESKVSQTSKDQMETRVPIGVEEGQLNLVGIQKFEVEKMSIRVAIPVSGRFITPTSVAFQIFESDLRYVRSGLRFVGESSFYPEEELAGTIDSVDSIVDPTSRTVRVLGQIKNSLRRIAPETGFKGEIRFELTDRVAIPESSVLHTGNGDLVYVFSEDGMLTPAEVKLGLKSEGFYDVIKGLRAGQFISSGPNFLIDSEAKIRGAGVAHDHGNN